MNLRQRQLLVLLLVPLLLARALLPSGFMLTFEGGNAQVVLCPADGPMPTAAGHEHMHHHHGTDGSASMGHNPGGCPFALAGGAPLAPNLTVLQFLPAVVDGRVVALDMPPRIEPTVASHLIRGPPQVS